ncbi:MAG: NirD/YgiW/YdeI family stress tolerance protein [Candidatus Omnitrophica bacterium]|nr:NirD/YgiW/YdeI family stress tolerance protein [Candidatus Omnitrophota bacterium]MDD5238110.1 NirD/YgiW/YdeI family stress tolerance protein [Candidatus Omnitrophota bacterium]
MFFKTLVAVMVLFFIATGAFAQFAGPGMTGGGNTTVKQILDRPVDDVRVILRGSILSKIAHEKYMFSDGTGQIIVDIDDEYFPYNRPITPQTTVEIAGEVDTEFMGTKVDVKQITIISDTGTATQQQGGFRDAPQPKGTNATNAP